MQPDFWHDRWRNGQTGFHQPSVDCDLLGHWQALALAKSSRVFVPLCGKSLDLLWLRAQGHHVVGVELSDIALQAFFMENGIAARRRASRHFDVYEADNLECLRGDFFDLTAARLGEVGAVYDRASLISWLPALRNRYVEHLTAMTRTGTRTLLVTLEYPQAEMQGPPFSVDSAEVHRLFARHHSVQELARRDILSSEARLRQRGVSSLTDVCYRIERL